MYAVYEHFQTLIPKNIIFNIESMLNVVAQRKNLNQNCINPTYSPIANT